MVGPSKVAIYPPIAITKQSPIVEFRCHLGSLADLLRVEIRYLAGNAMLGLATSAILYKQHFLKSGYAQVNFGLKFWVVSFLGETLVRKRVFLDKLVHGLAWILDEEVPRMSRVSIGPSTRP